MAIFWPALQSVNQTLVTWILYSGTLVSKTWNDKTERRRDWDIISEILNKISVKCERIFCESRGRGISFDNDKYSFSNAK